MKITQSVFAFSEKSKLAGPASTKMSRGHVELEQPGVAVGYEFDPNKPSTSKAMHRRVLSDSSSSDAGSSGSQTSGSDGSDDDGDEDESNTESMDDVAEDVNDDDHDDVVVPSYTDDESARRYQRVADSLKIRSPVVRMVRLKDTSVPRNVALNTSLQPVAVPEQQSSSFGPTSTATSTMQQLQQETCGSSLSNTNADGSPVIPPHLAAYAGFMDQKLNHIFTTG